MKGIVHHCFFNPCLGECKQDMSYLTIKKWQRGKYMAKNQVTNGRAAITALQFSYEILVLTTIRHQQIYEKHWHINIKLSNITDSCRHPINELQPPYTINNKWQEFSSFEVAFMIKSTINHSSIAAVLYFGFNMSTSCKNHNLGLHRITSKTK